jgi:hypothetical protein
MWQIPEIPQLCRLQSPTSKKHYNAPGIWIYLLYFVIVLLIAYILVQEKKKFFGESWQNAGFAYLT